MPKLFSGQQEVKTQDTSTATSRRINTQLLRQQLDLAKLQLEQSRRAVGGQKGREKETRGLLKENIRLLRDELKLQRRDRSGLEGVAGAEQVAERLPGEFKDLFRQLDTLQSDVKRGRTASAADKALIQKAANEAIEAGLIDIERFQTEGLEEIRNVLAPSRGLRPGDSPIIDRGGLIVREGTRQAGQLVSGLRSQQAQQTLLFPLARRAADLSAIGLQAEFLSGQQGFQAALRDRAFQNRLLLGSALGDINFQVAQQGIGLASGIPAQVAGTLAAIAASRGQSQTSTNPAAGLSAAGSLAGGLGGLLQGFSLISSRILKDPVCPVDVEALADRVKLLQLDMWRWKFGGDHSAHCGPYAEDMRDLFGVGDGKAFPVYDAIGILFALVKAIDLRLGRLDEALRG